jgi:hypothetical protein
MCFKQLPDQAYLKLMLFGQAYVLEILDAEKVFADMLYNLLDKPKLFNSYQLQVHYY